MHVITQLIAGELRTSCVTSQGEDSGSLCLVFPRLHVAFHFAEFVWSPLTVINHSHEYDCVLSSSALQTLEWFGELTIPLHTFSSCSGGRIETGVHDFMREESCHYSVENKSQDFITIGIL